MISYESNLNAKTGHDALKNDLPDSQAPEPHTHTPAPLSLRFVRPPPMNTYSIERAKSSHGQCGGVCKLMIEKGELRFATLTSTGRLLGKYKHLSCVKPEEFDAAVAAHGSLAAIPGVSACDSAEKVEMAARNAVAAKERLQAKRKAERKAARLAEAEALAAKRAEEEKKKQARNEAARKKRAAKKKEALGEAPADKKPKAAEDVAPAADSSGDEVNSAENLATTTA